jgi:hypothetical protein
MSGAPHPGRVPPDVVRRWLVDSCAAQGVPVVVSDPRVLAQVAVLVSGRGGRRPRQAQRAPASGPALSEPPDGLHTVRVQRAGPLGARGDDRVVEHGADHGVLAVEVEGGPLSA